MQRRVWTTTCSGALLIAVAMGSAVAPTGRSRTVSYGRPSVRSTAVQVPAATPHLAPRAPSVPKAARPAQAAPALRRGHARDVFEGLGAWVDLYDYGLDPSRVSALLARSGVRTLYLQTARSNTRYVVHPRAGRWLVAAHRHGVKVVGWYLPYYRTPKRDFQRTMAIKRYEYRGHRFDGLGVDIEFRPRGFPRSRWNRNVASVAAMVYAGANGFPVAAIPPPPLQMQIARGHWAGFPWEAVGRNADSIMLMSYWSDRRGCPAIRVFCAYEYTAVNVKLTRTLVGARPGIHIIGGIGDRMSDADLRAFIRGARDSGADGASIYDVATMRMRWWRSLRSLASLGH